MPQDTSQKHEFVCQWVDFTVPIGKYPLKTSTAVINIEFH